MSSVNTVWAIIRTDPAGQTEVVGAFTDRARAQELAGELGEGHAVVSCGLDTGVRALHTWACKAQVVSGKLDVGTPHRLAGAARLLHEGEEVGEVDKVVLDEEAGKLEAVFSVRVVHYLTAYATSADRALQLARAAGEDLAARES